MDLQLYIRQLRIYNLYNSGEVHYEGLSPYTLSQIAGPLNSARKFPSHPGFENVTNDVSDLMKMRLTWSIDRDSSGQTGSGALQPKKGVSGNITFEGEAYRLLKRWLVEDVSAPLNAIDVKIQDTGCGLFYEGYQIKSTDITWCEDDTCTYSVVLKQQDELYACIQKTLITDNWQGWYQPEPANGKKHPRFSYCNEARPNGMLIMVWWMSGMNGAMLLTLIPLLFALNGIFAVINVIIGIVNTIAAIVGGGSVSSVNWQTISYFDFGAMLDSYGQQYVESAGCGREHPASLIRDYITNVCDKCGIEVDATTAPVFFAPKLSVETSDRGVMLHDNHHYNACLLTASVSRGIRRFRSLNVTGFGGNNENTTQFWIPDNGAIMALSDMLDLVKGVYNADWRVAGGKLYFQRKDFFLDNNYIYDFSIGSPDRAKLVEGICYEPNDKRYAASLTGLWSPDGSDTCGNEAGNTNGTGHMNDVISLGFTDNNPLFQGVESRTVQLGATKFRLDGASTDYIYDAMQVLCNGSVFTPFTNGIMRDFVSPHIRKYCDYALLLENETTALPKILIWDGESHLNAKAARMKAAWPGAAAVPEPDVNPAYNPGMVAWHDRHPPQTKVIGENLTLGSAPDGEYRVTDYFSLVITKNPAILVNWPMFFAVGYNDSLWDWFHWIDDPRKNPRANRNFRLKIALCCEDLTKIKAAGDASNIVLSDKIKLPHGYFRDGIIKEITVSYDPSDPSGGYIEIKGEL